MELLFRLTEHLFGRLQPPDGQRVGRLCFGDRRLQPMAGLLGVGQALAQLVVLVLEYRHPAFGGDQALAELVQ